MVFTKLDNQEKDAFFSLLDEYFTARPEILNAVKSGNTNTNNNASTSTNTTTTSSFSSPNFRKEAAAAGAAVTKASDVASKFVSSGFKHASSFSGGGGGGGTNTQTQTQTQTKPNPPTSSSFRGGGGGGGGIGSTSASQRGTEDIDTQVGSLADRIKALQGGGGVSGLLSRNDTGKGSSSIGSGGGGGVGGGGGTSSPGPKKFGNLDTSAVSNMLAQRGGSAPPPPKAAAPPPAPPPPKQQEPEGEWAEALYDYDSAEAGDLPLKEGQRVLVVEHTSDDWWTGEANGKQGLFPASYVQLV